MLAVAFLLIIVFIAQQQIELLTLDRTGGKLQLSLVRDARFGLHQIEVIIALAAE